MKQWNPIVIDKNMINIGNDKISIIHNDIINNSQNINDLTLYTGKLGVCIFLYYYSLINEDKDAFWEEYYYSINSEISELNPCGSYYVACNMNFALATSHLYNCKAIDLDINDYFNECDDVFYELMKKYVNENSYDMLYGSMQIATYFLNRLNSNPAKYSSFLNTYLDLMNSKADLIGDDKYTWKSMIDRDMPDVLGYNLGMAHGIPSLIVFFSKLSKSGFKHPLLDNLLSRSCRYLLSIEQDYKEYKSHFGIKFLPGQIIKEMSRIGWCYGDLGVGYAFLYASSYNKDKQGLSLKSYEILKDTFNRKNKDETFIVDDCLCHGTSGVGLMYDMLFRFTNIREYKEMALYWYKETIEVPFNEDYYGGYKIYKGYHQYASDLSFLSGISGIGLSLISAIYPIEPKWNEFLILN